MDRVGEYTLKIMRKARWYNLWLLSFFKKYLKGDILEVGSGIGNFSMLLKNFGNVTAIDIGRNYLENYKTQGVDFGYGDIEKGEYFFKGRKFDTIVCLNVIEHVKNDGKAFENIYKLLKEEGTAVILVPAHKYLFSKYDKLLKHYRRYNLPETADRAENFGFKIIEARYVNWWGAMGWFLYMKILKKTDFPENELSVFDLLGRFLLWPEKLLKIPFGLSVLLIIKK